MSLRLVKNAVPTFHPPPREIMYTISVGLQYDGHPGEYTLTLPYGSSTDQHAIDFGRDLIANETYREGLVGMGKLMITRCVPDEQGHLAYSVILLTDAKLLIPFPASWSLRK